MRLVRTAGALTVLALASFVTLMIRREKRLNIDRQPTTNH
jgi:hypothetical protein